MSGVQDAPLETGQAVRLAPGVQRVLAPNPSPMTGPGTNSYVIGHGPCAVIDPGVSDPAHLEALCRAAGQRIDTILLTHRHADHAGGVAELAARTGATVRAWPKSRPAAHDLPVAVDRPLIDAQTLRIGSIELVVHHMPGHAADHAVFQIVDSGLLLAGDTLMEAVTVVIIPPDGDMSAYFDTLDRLAALAPAVIAPGHGRLLMDPAGEIAAVRAHRTHRETQIRARLHPERPMRAEAITDQLYPGLDSRLRPMAAAQIRAHLIRLADCGQAVSSPRGWCSSPDGSGR